MTCEIAIMNRLAVALAADSATTVSQWADGKREVRYFKGANKIFQLSDHHPVGLMIYGTAALQGVPWEIIAKDFRTNLGSKSFKHVSGYADALFDFIAKHKQLFPKAFQKDNLGKEAYKAALSFLFFEAAKDQAFQSAQNDQEKRDALTASIERARLDIEARPYPTGISAADVQRAVEQYLEGLSTDITEGVSDTALEGCFDVASVVDTAIKRVLITYESVLDSTGVVVAGYGDEQFFPSYKEYQCYGVLLDKLLYKEGNAQEIDPNKHPADIQPFAQTSMVNTFQLGVGPDVFSNLQTEFVEALNRFSKELFETLSVNGVADLEKRIEDEKDAFMEKWFNAAYKEHGAPLLRVVGSLPIDEMAELAETLIMLQSVKEKVTQPTESVGGPIDVAVITKGDGFIWIKRKHYFDPELNARFFVRQQQRYS